MKNYIKEDEIIGMEIVNKPEKVEIITESVILSDKKKYDGEMEVNNCPTGLNSDYYIG